MTSTIALINYEHFIARLEFEANSHLSQCDPVKPLMKQVAAHLTTLLERCEKAEAMAGESFWLSEQLNETRRQRDEAMKALQAVDATAAFNTDLGKYMIEPHALDMVSNAIRDGGKQE